MALDSYGFSGSFLQTFLYFLCTLPFWFYSSSFSTHTFQSSVTEALYLPTSVSTRDSFLFSWFMQIDSLPSFWYFYCQVTQSTLSLISDYFSFLLWVPPLTWLCLWFPGYSTADPFPTAEELKAFLSFWLDCKPFSRNLKMVFRDSLCYTARLMLLFV